MVELKARVLAAEVLRMGEEPLVVGIAGEHWR